MLQIESNEDWQCNICGKIQGGIQIRTDYESVHDLNNGTGDNILEGWKNICNNCLFKAIVKSLNKRVIKIPRNGRLSEFSKDK